MNVSRTVSVRALRSALLSSLFLASGASADDSRGVAAVTTNSEESHFGYSQSLSPDHWAELPGNARCSAGTTQSPVALSTATADHPHLNTPSFNYFTSHVRMTNTGHTVEFTYDAGSTLRLGNTEYKLAQFHFHTPSEHTEDGVQYPLELHLVHKDASGNAAVVVGVLIKEGSVNAALFNAFLHLPKHEGEQSAPTGALINASALLPRNKAFFQYAGSLTTPPCSEGLQWFVMTHPIEMSDAQIAAFQRLPHLNPNNRPVQPLNGRTIAIHGGY